MFKKLNNKKAQVAVEFLFMFIISASVIIYIFYFALSLSVLQYRQYMTFMTGRAITSSSPSYSVKSTRAGAVSDMYNNTASSSMNVSTGFECSIDDQAANQGFRNVLQYWSGEGDKPRYDIFSTAGIACSVNLPYLLPNVIAGTGGQSLTVAIESMTGTEISDAHCKCLMNFKNNWSDCLQENDGGQGLAIIDNDC